MGIPSYFTAASGLWATATSKSPPVSGFMILNPASGPGNSPDSGYQGVVAAAQLAGLKVIGYVDTNYGAVLEATAKTQIDEYGSWYAVSGIFFDRVATSVASLQYYGDLVGYAGGFTCLNFGTVPDQGMIGLASTNVLFEDVYANWSGWSAPTWINAYPQAYKTVLIYACPDVASLNLAFTRAVSLQFGFVFVTDGTGSNPWAGLPAYWTTEQTLLIGS